MIMSNFKVAVQASFRHELTIGGDRRAVMDAALQITRDALSGPFVSGLSITSLCISSISEIDERHAIAMSDATTSVGALKRKYSDPKYDQKLGYPHISELSRENWAKQCAAGETELGYWPYVYTSLKTLAQKQPSETPASVARNPEIDAAVSRLLKNWVYVTKKDVARELKLTDDQAQEVLDYAVESNQALHTKGCYSAKQNDQEGVNARPNDQASVKAMPPASDGATVPQKLYDDLILMLRKLWQLNCNDPGDNDQRGGGADETFQRCCDGSSEHGNPPW